MAVPTPGPVKIDGRDDDWDLSAGVWSYNSPELVDTYSIWTHLMWDEKGLYYLARVQDSDPMKNATVGVDFGRSWQGDAVQLRMIFDDQTAEEHQMHMTAYYSTAEQKPYLIVHHGGLKKAPPYDLTGPDRPDLLDRFGERMEASGGEVVFRAWDNGKGYNIEAFMPWSYLRLNGRGLKPGDAFVFGWEALWGQMTAPGKAPEIGYTHRLADGVKDASANRIFMFRARTKWGSAVISAKGRLGISEAQRELQQSKRAALSDYSTAGPIPIRYELPASEPQSAPRDVTLVIENAKGERVRNLFGQYPRSGTALTDYWDGLDDDGKPVEPGAYTAIIADHAPIKVELLSTLYNAGTPPWPTDQKNVVWGSDHGAPAAVATQGDRVIVSFSLPEAGVGLNGYRTGQGIEWNSRNSAADLVMGDDFVYSFEYNFWQSKFLVSRFDPSTGKSAPFVQADGTLLVSREIALTIPAQNSLGAGSVLATNMGVIAFTGKVSIAQGGGAVWLLVPDEGVYKINATTGALVEKRPAPGLLVVRSRAGKLYGIFEDKSLWSLTSDLQRETRLLDLAAIGKPGRFGVSQDGKRIGVCDVATNQVFVYELAAKTAAGPVTIGKPSAGSERPGGVFDRNDVEAPASVDFDNLGRVWVAEGTLEAHRTSVWNADGSFADEFWGATPYGATHGYEFAHDATRFIVMGIEFKLDEAIDPLVRKSAEVPLFFHPHLAKTQGSIHRVKGSDGKWCEFAVASPGVFKQRSIVIYRRDARGEFVPAAGLFDRIDAKYRKTQEFPAIADQLSDSTKPRGWIDLNGNGKIEPDELTELTAYFTLAWSSGWVRPDMTLFTADMLTYPLTGINAQGVPLYDFAHPQRVPNPIKAEDKQGACGTPIMDSHGNITDGIRFHTMEGRRGAWPNRYGRQDAPAAQLGVLIAPFRTNGVVEDIPGIGSATMLQGDRGQWFLMSFDGLYLSSLFQDLRGLFTMDETIIGGESFGGHFWRVTDGPMKGKVLLQTGKVVCSIFEVKNLDTIRRQTVALTVSSADIQAGLALAAGRGKAREEGPLVIATVKALPETAPVPTLAREAALVDGQPFTLIEEAGNPAHWFKVSLLTDGRDLALVWQVADASPWKNGADHFTHAFAGGDAVDLKLISPTMGAIRLLAAPLDGKPQAIFWRKEAPVKENPQVYVVANSPKSARSFDVVKLLPEARIDVKTTGSGYTLLMRVPLTALGLDGRSLPETLAGVAGVIFSDQAGTNRVARLYWHDKVTGMVNDVPTESAIDPRTLGKITLSR